MAMKWYWLSADGPGSPRIAGTYVRTLLTGNNVIWVLDFFCIFGQNVWAIASVRLWKFKDGGS